MAMDYYGFMFLANRFMRFVFTPRSVPGVAAARFALALACLAGVAGSLPAWAQTGTLPKNAVTAAPVVPPTAPEPNKSALDTELFYQLLMGELSVYGGEPGEGFSLLLDGARKSNDGKLYERAVQVALQGRSPEPALAAARAWAKALPNSRDANRYVLQILVGLNRVAESSEALKAEINGTPARERNTMISAIPRIYSRATDKKLAATVVEQALADSLASPTHGVTAWTTLGRVRLEAGDTPGVLEAARRAQALDANAEAPAGLALQLMDAKTPAAEEIVRKHLAGKPSLEFRMGYARALIDGQRLPEAAQQLQAVTRAKADHPQAWLVLGSLELQDRKYEAAEKSLRRHVEVNQAAGGNRTDTARAESSRGMAQAYLQLAQIAEQRKDFTLAESWLAKIDSAEDMVNAQSRRANILAKQGKLEEGRKLLRALPEKAPNDARMKLMAEVQLLRDNKQFQAGYDLLTEKSRTMPADQELNYDRAMLAEKIGKLDEMERLLRQIIATKPDYQHAYNALGYSFAERNVRLPEARALIQKALEFAPGDPFITDSLGWVEFRAGNLAEAERILEGAFKTRPDAEIAAHLGEVLWVRGKRDRALTIWREGAALNGDNETLLETLKRLRVKL